MSTNNKSIGLFGFGVVGQGFYNFVDREGEKRIPTVVVKSNNKQRNNNEVEYITEGDYLLQNDNPSVIVEVINNDKEAFDIVSKALIKRKKVVSASKKLLATRLPELLALEQQYGGTLLYEAAVAGSIPIIRILNDFYIQEKIRDIKGIVNGSSNYILTKLFEGGAKYEEVLEEAKDLGFAEKDPTSDVGGFDALYKLVLLTLQGFGAIINPDKIGRAHV